MKIIEDSCTQPRRYADAIGKLIIELEPGDDREAIIQKYEHRPQGFMDDSCIFDAEKSTDTMLYFNKRSPYCD